MNTKKKEIVLRKHSAMIQMSNLVTAHQRKVFNALVYHAKLSMNRDIREYIFNIDLAEIKKIAGIDNTNKKQFRESLKQLSNINVEYNILKKHNDDIWGSFVLLSWLEIENGILKYSFPPPIIENLRNPSMYATLDLVVMRGFDKKYAIALYELAKDYINSEIPKMTIVVFRKLMGIGEKQYSNGNDLKRYVIDVAVEEIHKKTGLHLTYTLFKIKRKIVSIKFYITKIKQLESKITESQNDMEFKELVALLPTNLSQQTSVKEQINKFLKIKDFDYVKWNILYSLKNSKENPKVYLQKALENNWGEALKAKEQGRLIQKELEFKKSNEEKKEMEEDIYSFEEYKNKCTNYFNSLAEEKRNQILEEMDQDSSIKMLSTEKMKLTTYFLKHQIEV